MPSIFQIQDIQSSSYRTPSITVYNRLEAHPRTANFDRSIKAEVRDALWMLTRQWQFGEFEGEDAATAVTTKILSGHRLMDEIHFPDNNVFSYDVDIPLETSVEREQLTGSLFLAVQMARYFIKLVKTKPGYTDLLSLLLIQYPLNYEPHKNDHEGIQLLNTVKGKIFNGFIFYTDSMQGILDAGVPEAFSIEITLFQNWFQRTYNQPVNNAGTCWKPSRLEYDFSVASSSMETAQQQKLLADHYHEGHLDWYSFDLKTPPNAESVTQREKENLQSYIPSPVSFKGMPNPRFWMMEENQTDFGKMSTSVTGLLHVLLAEFALTCSNDWFVLPYKLPINSLCEIKGIVVTDVFGEHTLIRPAGRGSESTWQRWAMFHHTELNKKANQHTSLFYLVPAVTKLLESSPVEQVKFLRDEMANMVWAVESTVPSAAGFGVSGNEMALEADVITPPLVNGGETELNEVEAGIKYVLGTTVPSNWIPFIPVKFGDSDAEISLQRASMHDSKGSLGTIVKEKPAPYYINEEVIPRSGVQVTRSFQMARWYNGATVLWIGRRKSNGEGEGLSNLKFDQIK